ncbi:proline--tRNA ligase [Pectinatus cerevisiiphilus]|uniref:Proline--tRNA ligase n=1 Tax=Pectinatus cerevisiiphilus TaxID=86956 RepID=A0A4V2URG3_9FIRM|nr:proline--tRNA ligase [Pectinatus cerevisiiphilus]TCS77392.1 prolyl-tRNA synthetase [Pectinatus cerevisiiphilus]
MRASKLYAPTLREVPAEAEIPSHQLMLRAGFIRKAAGGVYTYLPLAWRTLRKIEQIIREEMDAAGGQEIAMPIMQPSELWKESGRWEVFGEEMFKLKDRHGREFCLGPTHEEIITDLVRNEVRSYKQLPLLLYQIQNKYRDEIRPRFGLMRGREFIMKDLYSFDKDEAGLDISYKKMYDAYTKIFSRCGLVFRPVEADSGAIGGSNTHEFTALAQTGESEIAVCTKCDYAANVEKAESTVLYPEDETELPLEKKATPNTKTIETVIEYLQLPIEKSIKAVAFQDEKDKLICVFVRGDHEVNEVKVQNAVGAISLRMADKEAILAAGGVPGFMSPIGLRKGTVVIVDATVMEMKNACCGANEVDMHYINANPKRDFGEVLVKDVRLMQKGDACPHCGAPVQITRGIEIGQVFKLGIKYSSALRATFLDENGREKPLIMGCYGIGVSRTMAAAIEQYHDENGIIWPRAIAPYEVALVPVNAKNEAQMKLAEKIYAGLQQAGIEVLLDDRKERAGVKFKDADLIGYPVRVTIGPKAVEEDKIEVKVRKTGELVYFTEENYEEGIKALLAKL